MSVGWVGLEVTQRVTIGDVLVGVVFCSDLEALLDRVCFGCFVG
jgi:hypothetical protein